jgi:peptidoglycan/xylan/chitin deacetylase (PgdA/CDA1 family)
MRRPILYPALLLAALFIVGAPGARAQSQRDAATGQREIAVTIDDLPLNGPRVGAARLRAMTESLLAALDRHRVPAVGFVNESLLYVPGETDEMISILTAWRDAGVELGNHTFSHLGFRNASLAAYEDDFVRGDALTRMLLGQKGQKPRYFRHPFLQTGPTQELEQSFEDFLSVRGYRVAPVTIDILDWMFLSAYAKARAEGDAAMLKRVSEEYLKYAAVKFDFCEKVSAELFGRPIRHVLLLHANELNADNFDALARMLEGRGYKFVTLERALEDPAYRPPEQYRDTSDWLLRWSFSKGVKFEPPPAPEFIQRIYTEAQQRPPAARD